MSSLYSRDNCQPHQPRYTTGSAGIAGRIERFLLVGVVGLGVNLAALWLLHGWLAVPLSPAAAVSILLSMVATFVLNELWTWGDRQRRSPLPARVAFYSAINGTGMLINWQLLLFFHHHGQHYQVANLLGAATAAVWNFLLNNFLTWRT